MSGRTNFLCPLLSSISTHSGLGFLRSQSTRRSRNRMHPPSSPFRYSSLLIWCKYLFISFVFEASGPEGTQACEPMQPVPSSEGVKLMKPDASTTGSSAPARSTTATLPVTPDTKSISNATMREPREDLGLLGVARMWARGSPPASNSLAFMRSASTSWSKFFTFDPQSILPLKSFVVTSRRFKVNFVSETRSCNKSKFTWPSPDMKSLALPRYSTS
mmetsp:Transcript_128604/g.274344  ORF Transcript_128604/g.274344 Transcript_128604/m.274344 type:complete len:217 (-) Transcript_128604:2251-2901(-)